MDEATTTGSQELPAAVQEKHGLIDEIKDGLEDFLAISEEAWEKIEAFFDGKKQEIVDRHSAATDTAGTAPADAQQPAE